MTHPDDAGRPTFVPENTYELQVGTKIENGDLKWHPSAHEWTEIQTLGYRTVTASQRGLYRRPMPTVSREAATEPAAPTVKA